MVGAEVTNFLRLNSKWSFFFKVTSGKSEQELGAGVLNPVPSLNVQT